MAGIVLSGGDPGETIRTLLDPAGHVPSQQGPVEHLHLTATTVGHHQAIRDDPQIEAEFTHRPQPGDILLWPAFLMHFVHPNLSDEKRISLSFNASLKWSDDYLPRQP